MKQFSLSKYSNFFDEEDTRMVSPTYDADDANERKPLNKVQRVKRRNKRKIARKSRKRR